MRMRPMPAVGRRVKYVSSYSSRSRSRRDSICWARELLDSSTGVSRYSSFRSCISIDVSFGGTYTSDLLRCAPSPPPRSPPLPFLAASFARFSFSITMAELSESAPSSESGPPTGAAELPTPASSAGAGIWDIRLAGLARNAVGSEVPAPLPPLLPVTAVFTSLSIW
uniref:Uncharacterized protein n=1 Tax=Anopheles coluzzii TaxID=1518534 RepID=A0A8W7PB20_ANOCL